MPPGHCWKQWWNQMIVQFSSVQSVSHVQLSVTPWITTCQASLSIINSQSSLKLMSIELVMPSSHLILCCPLLLLPPIPPSIRVFSNESTLHMRWPKYWVSALASVLPKKSRADLLQNGLTGSPCSPRDSQESYPAPQFKSINSLALSFLHAYRLAQAFYGLRWTSVAIELSFVHNVDNHLLAWKISINCC